MYFNVLDHISDRGEGLYNEDLGGINGRLAWIMDGATDVNLTGYFSGSSDAKWLVDKLHKKLSEMATDSDESSLPDMYGGLATYIRNELSQVAYPKDRIPPACSCGIARIVPNRRVIELALVGDVYLFSTQTRSLLSNSYFANVESAGVRRARKRIGNEQLLSRDREEIALRRQGSIAGIDGQFVLSNNPEVARGVHTKTISARIDDVLLLCTDGFARLIEGYGRYASWHELSEVALSRDLGHVLQELREYESQHQESEHNYKTSDDVCAMLLDVREEA